jgi:DNA-binding NarL/FixJ family response regulator
VNNQTSHHGRLASTVVVVSNVNLFRLGLVQLLAKSHSVKVIGMIGCRPESLESQEVQCADFLLIDGTAGGSISLVRTAYLLRPKRPIIVLGIPDDIGNLVAWTEAGAISSLTENASQNDLLACIDRIRRGSYSLPPEVVSSLVSRLAQLSTRRQSGQLATLTARELKVITYINQGLENKEIARQMNIEVSTVKNHVHSILTKLHLRRRFEAARWFESQTSKSEAQTIPHQWEN